MDLVHLIFNLFPIDIPSPRNLISKYLATLSDFMFIDV